MRASCTRSTVVVVVAVIVMAGCSSSGAGTGGGGASGEPSTPEWLYVVQSDGETTFDPASGRLSIPAGSGQAFTDRPYRDTRATSPQSFVNLWRNISPDSFANDPPNAVLTHSDATAGSVTPRSVVCEITGGVEYFNMLSFTGDFSLQTRYLPVAKEYQVGIPCPPRESAMVPPSSFDLRLPTLDETSKVSCYGSSWITIAQLDLPTLPYCRVGGICVFRVRASNDVTGAIYSDSLVEIELTSVPQTIIPQLEPATLPAC